MPWNFPFWQVFRFLAPALMAGNVGLLKHASNVPQCALAIESLVRRAGFPRGTFQTLLIEVQPGRNRPRRPAHRRRHRHRQRSRRPRHRRPGRMAHQKIRPRTRRQRSLHRHALRQPRSRRRNRRPRPLVNTGQSCIAAKRFIIADEIYDAFESRFVAGMESVRVGDPMHEGTEIGPLATARAVELLEAQVKAATRVGARVLTGGERMLGEGNYFEPTVLTGVPRTSAVYREEIFGPVAMLFRATDIDEAIAIANDTPFGLAASAWTRDPAEQQRFVAELQCGAVFLNAMVASDPRLPFGGIKRSGYGRELSATGMREFLNAKTVVIAAARQR